MKKKYCIILQQKVSLSILLFLPLGSGPFSYRSILRVWASQVMKPTIQTTLSRKGEKLSSSFVALAELGTNGKKTLQKYTLFQKIVLIRNRVDFSKGQSIFLIKWNLSNLTKTIST